MTEKEEEVLNYLKREMDQFISKNYGVRLRIPVIWSNRLRVRWGYFKVGYRYVIVNRNGRKVRKRQIVHDEMKIVLNKDLIKAKSKGHVLGVVKHEALHYALCITNKPFSDGDKHFEQELKKHGLPSMSLESKDLNVKSNFWVWSCTGCGKIAIKGGKTRKDYSRGYKSKCCGKKLEENGWVKLKSDQEYIK